VAVVAGKLVRLERELLDKDLLAVLVFLLVLMALAVAVQALLVQLQQPLHKPLVVVQDKYPQLQAREFSMLVAVVVEWKMLAHLV
jgi:hypothetical protein